MFKLVIQDDEGKTTVVPLIRDEITIGRKEGNTIRLTERNVSRRHARILRNNGEVHIEDLGSYNGIRVNNARIAERVSLRVSDQVQIGDYKLYLKAEGVEQVDDARTMPIERIDSQIATEIQQAVAAPTGAMTAQGPAVAAPTGPVAVQTPAAATAPATSGISLVGNPARTMVAIADTDPQGRPVATAATVAALTAPAQYGKLVVLSSNFAGKEFELSRPQMIIGRTDENDIVVNHRSISRNHAKLVREPETGRYTVSDLQSSNGVRVNGQDYGKVELRRGDVVDLGHVRLRFIEPGEDFVFSRDAVVTDVPDSGSKRGMMVAVIFAIVLLGGVIAFFVLKGNDKPSNPVVNGQRDADAGTGAIALNPSADADTGGGTVGSGEDPTSDDGSLPEIPTPDAAPTVPVEPGNAQQEAVATRCNEAIYQQDWDKLGKCGQELAGLDDKRGDEFQKQATREKAAKASFTRMTSLLAAGRMSQARDEVTKIQNARSVLTDEARKKYGAAEANLVGDLVVEVRKKVDKNCKAYQSAINRIENDNGRVIADKVSAAVRCQPEQTTTNPTNPTNPKSCDVTALKDEGKVFYTKSQWGAALSSFEKAIDCKADKESYLYAALAACKSGRGTEAKRYFKSVADEKRANVQQTCLQKGIDLQ
jgi:pSer/pThr/pTyr-binding forkhead associated (FHA) protein